MNLTDANILELNDLCNAVIDQTISDEQKARLAHWLSTSEDAREFYVRVTGLSASLCHYASEMQTGEPDTLAPPHKASRRWWAFTFLAVAASIGLTFWLSFPKRAAPAPQSSAVEEVFVAQLTSGKDCRWVDSAAPIAPGARLRKGQRVELASGFAEIMFDSGAQVLLQGPASLDLNSAWSATLNHGTLKASLPPEAMGFKISNSTVEVVDIGTEFTMIADVGGTAADVLVLKGEVETAPKSPADQQPFVLREKESRRFATSGVSNIHDSAQKFKTLSEPIELDRFVPPVRYAHWSFDESDGTSFKAFSSGLSESAPSAKVEDGGASLSALHSAGRFQGALRFDGNLYAKTAFPGISDNSPHTIAFWVKVPTDATPSGAYAMVAWGANSAKFGSHPFHIAWNRNRNEGLMGVLRTDYGRGYAIGATPLRDGRWHHIAVVFIPRDDAESPMEVKQYVDGRLEGEGRPSPPGSDIFMSSENSAATNGSIWLGCRLGIKGEPKGRFCGDMDELFIANRALEPPEIVRLMNSNQPDE